MLIPVFFPSRIQGLQKRGAGGKIWLSVAKIYKIETNLFLTGT